MDKFCAITAPNLNIYIPVYLVKKSYCKAEDYCIFHNKLLN